jgi:uncharacterized membrane protein
MTEQQIPTPSEDKGAGLSSRESAIEKIEAIDAEKPEILAAAALLAFSGPLPPPSILRSYEEIVPGSAKEMHDAVLSMHRHQMEMGKLKVKATLERQERYQCLFARGQLFAFLLAILLIICGTACILKGHDWAGGTIVTGALTSLVLAFLSGRQPIPDIGEAEKPEDESLEQTEEA